MNTQEQLDPAMGEALRSRLDAKLRNPEHKGTGIASTVCPRTWHLTDTDLDRDAAFFLAKPYTI